MRHRVFRQAPKFVHQWPRTLILNNLNTITPTSFPTWPQSSASSVQLLRTVPGSGLLVNAADRNLAEVLAMGCWSQSSRSAPSGFSAEPLAPTPAGSGCLGRAGNRARCSGR